MQVQEKKIRTFNYKVNLFKIIKQFVIIRNEIINFYEWKIIKIYCFIKKIIIIIYKLLKN